MVLLHPAAVGTASGVERLEFGILHEPVAFKVEPQDRTGLETAVACDGFGRNVEDARFGRQDEEAVLGERPAGGAKPVAVERRAEAYAIRERDGGRSIPRFHQRGVVFVEGAHVVSHVVLRTPGLRNEHHHRMRRIASGCDEQLEDVVERGGVGLAAVNDGEQFLQFVAEEVGGERRLACGQRVQVALERIDFAVVRQRAEGVCQLPRGEGVR